MRPALAERRDQLLQLLAAPVAEPEPTGLVVGHILLGADDVVTRLVAKQIAGVGPGLFGDCKALGVLGRRGPDGRAPLIGGVVYHNYRGHDVEMSAAMLHRRWARRGVLRALFDFAFNPDTGLGCRRMTTITAADNTAARRANEAMGFALEGVHPKAWHEGGRDAVSYGMLRENCRWIKD